MSGERTEEHLLPGEDGPENLTQLKSGPTKTDFPFFLSEQGGWGDRLSCKEEPPALTLLFSPLPIPTKLHPDSRTQAE